MLAFYPSRIEELKPYSTDIDDVKVFPFLNSSEKLEELKSELPSYVAKSGSMPAEVDSSHGGRVTT